MPLRHLRRRSVVLSLFIEIADSVAVTIHVIRTVKFFADNVTFGPVFFDQF